MLLGGDEVLHALEDESGVPHGETDAEGLISVEHAECIGACGGAPAVQVNYELIEGVTPRKSSGTGPLASNGLASGGRNR